MGNGLCRVWGDIRVKSSKLLARLTTSCPCRRPCLVVRLFRQARARVNRIGLGLATLFVGDAPKYLSFPPSPRSKNYLGWLKQRFETVVSNECRPPAPMLPVLRPQKPLNELPISFATPPPSILVSPPSCDAFAGILLSSKCLPANEEWQLTQLFLPRFSARSGRKVSPLPGQLSRLHPTLPHSRSRPPHEFQYPNCSPPWAAIGYPDAHYFIVREAMVFVRVYP